MLQESFLASVLLPEGGRRSSSSSSSTAKDAFIYLQSFRPAAAASTTSFKKSSTHPNCLAVSATHVFAAQAEKAVVHVYSREKGNQEATVPFPERIHSATFAGDHGGAGVLMLGTEGGRIIAWEVCTGRQISTPASHLQPVTTLATDPGGQFLLSGSEDSNIHVWSILSLLSFSLSSATDGLSMSTQQVRAPLHVLTRHQASITSIVTGHSSSTSNIAISASKDESCIVWDYQSGELLRTFLLSGPPISLALDPCDRAFYAGYQDGSIQLVDFFRDTPLAKHPLYDPALTSTPIQASASSVWTAQSLDLGATLCLDVVYDGNYVLTGHQSGKVCLWDVASGKYVKEVADYGAPVTNIQMLPVTGFLNQPLPRLKVHQVVKPRYDPSFSGNDESGSGLGSSKYTITVQFPSTLPGDDHLDMDSRWDPIEAAMTGPSFPPGFLAASLAELTAHTSSRSNATNGSIPNASTEPETEALREKVMQLETSLEELRATHKETWKKMVEMRLEKIQMRKAERARMGGRRKQPAREGDASGSFDDESGSILDEESDENGIGGESSELEDDDDGGGDVDVGSDEGTEKMDEDSSNMQHNLDKQIKDR